MAESKDVFEPLYFSELSFENLKCFSDRQTVSFLDRDGRPAMWNLLLGVNGVGKTTILQSLAWMSPVEAAKPHLVQPALLDEENPVLEQLVRADANKMVVEARFAGAASTRKASAKYLLKTGIDVTLNEEHELTDSKPKRNRMKQAPDLHIVAYAANRLVGTLNLNDEKVADPIASLFEPVTMLYDPEAILSDLDYAALKEDTKSARSRSDRVVGLLATILPDVGTLENVIFLGPKIPGNRSKNRGLRFRTPYGVVPFSGLSLGYQTTLAWTVDLAWRMIRKHPKSDNPFAEPAIVLLDEIDLHLHPTWQRSIRQDLSAHFPATQFIVTTHSPIMAQASLDANLVILERQGDHVIVNNDAEKYVDWRIDQIAIEMFGLRSARPPSIQALFDERSLLLSNRSRTNCQETRLSEIEARIQELPVWDTPEDQAAMDVIRRAASLIKDTSKNET